MDGRLIRPSSELPLFGESARPGASAFAGQLTVAAACGIALGLGTWIVSPAQTLGVVLAGLFLVAVTRWPALGLLAILGVKSTILFEEDLPLIPIGVGSLHLTDILLLYLLGLVSVRLLVGRRLRDARTPLDLPILAYYGTALLATFVAISLGSIPRQDALREAREVTYYLAFFAVTNLVREHGQLRLLAMGMFTLGTVVAGAMIGQFLLGDRVVLMPGIVGTLVTQGSAYGGITRLTPPGQALVQVTLITACVAFALNPALWRRPLAWIQLGVLFLADALTFNRSYWIGVLVAIVLLACLVPGRARRRLILCGLVAVALAVSGFALVSNDADSQAARLASAFSGRMATLSDAQTLLESQGSTLHWRAAEYDYIWPQIAANPILGLGLGATYRPLDPRLDWRGPGDTGFDGRAYTHNGHAWVMLKSGLLGYAFLMWFSLAFLIRGLVRWRRVPDPFIRTCVLSFSLAIVGVLAGSATSPMLAEWFWIPVIAVMVGSAEAALRTIPDVSGRRFARSATK